MSTVENALIIPMFTMIIVVMVLFNMSLHNRILESAKEARVKYEKQFNEGCEQGEILRAKWAVDKVVS